MSIIDTLIVLAFIAYAIASGFRAKDKASENLEEYFLAGRSLPGWKAGISMAATQFSADTPLLVTGLIATAGIFSLWRLWIYALAFLLMGFVLAPSWRRAGVLTDAELTELRYGRKPAAALRGIKAIYFGTVFNCTVLAMVLFATKEVAEPFLLWDQWLPAPLFAPIEAMVQWVDMPMARVGVAGDLWIRSTNNVISIGAIVAVTTLYSATGGLRSVVQTDIMQFFLMMFGTLAYAIWVTHAAGGLDAISEKVHTLFAQGGPGGITPDQILAFTPSQAKDTSLAVLAVFALQWLVQMNADGTGYLAQRSMACRSDRDAKQAAIVFTIAQVLVRSLLWLPIGLGLLVVFAPDLSLDIEVLKAEREATFVRGIKELLPPGLMGLMLTGMLAALASTVDTHLKWGSSYWTNDIYRRFICRSWLKREPAGKELVWVARLSNILILLTGLVVMTRLSSIQRAWQASLLLGAGMGVLLVLRWLWWRVNAWGEISSIVASSLIAIVFVFKDSLSMDGWVPDGEAMQLLVMAILATGTGIVVSLATGPESEERLKIFFQRVAPPGFWGPVAAACGKDPKASVLKLWQGLLGMGLAAFSIFCLLTGLGSWLVGSPSPVWFPWRGVWIAINLLVGLALVPFWWR
ncbi:MAG: sodium:solute symporter family protein, partial [Myxococcota bacterium]